MAMMLLPSATSVAFLGLAPVIAAVFISISISEVAGFPFGLLLLSPYVIQLRFIKCDLDCLVPAQISVLGGALLARKRTLNHFVIHKKHMMAANSDRINLTCGRQAPSRARWRPERGPNELSLKVDRQAAALFLIAPTIAVRIAPPAPPATAWEITPPMLKLPD